MLLLLLLLLAPLLPMLLVLTPLLSQAIAVIKSDACNPGFETEGGARGVGDLWYEKWDSGTLLLRRGCTALRRAILVLVSSCCSC